MADNAGQADIRGIDIQKLAVAYETEVSVFKKLVRNSGTQAREIRWYQKTAGVITGPSTTAITASQIANTDFGSRPVVAQQSWTRQTSYVRKYFVESPFIPEEDIKDSDVDVLAGNLRDLVEAVEYQVDQRIWDILTESRNPVNINSNASTAAWDAGSGQDPVKDIMKAIQDIRTNTHRELTNGFLFLSPKDHTSLLVWLIGTKGSSIPQFSSARLGDGAIMEILGLRVIVNTNVTADYALVSDPSNAAVWKSFVPVTTAIITEEGIGRKIRVWEEGEAILERPKYCSLITNTAA